MTEGGRPQDQGRSHRRRGRQSVETTTLLAEYQDAMRTELRACLAELRGVVPAPGILPPADGEPAPTIKRPNLADRMRLWDLAIKLGRELGTAVDPGPDPGEPPVTQGPRKRARSRIDYGPD